MGEMVRIKEAAEILGVSEMETRIILKYHGVVGIEEQIEAKKGKPAKLYQLDQVRRIASLRVII